MRRADGAFIYEAVRQLVDSALLADGSLFTPGRAVWTSSAIEDLHRRFNLQPDTSGDVFDVKLRRQLKGAADATIQFAAEALFIHLLIVDDIGGRAKRRLLSAVLSWMREPVTVPAKLDEALDHGLVSGGLRGERTQMDDWAAHKGAEEIADYRATRNGESIDRLPELRGPTVSG
jgi:5-methylcytosine-specific restriction enzyme B